MSTTLQKRPYWEALGDAHDLRDLVDRPPHRFDAWHIAGSVRRRQAAVGDVEHVVVPTFGDVPDGESLFAATVRVNLVWQRIDGLRRQQVVRQHLYTSSSGAVSPRWGEKYRGLDFRGFCHEIFMADQDNLGLILAIRTGPAHFSKALVQALQANGFVSHGGYVRDKRAWFCPCGWRGSEPTWRAPGENTKAMVWRNNGGDGNVACCPDCGAVDVEMAVVSVPDERAMFRRCGIEWIEPGDR